MRIKRRWGSHLPVLIRLVSETTGPIVELGGGVFSTPFLHWACAATGRQLVTYECVPAWHKLLSTFNGGHHSVQLVTDWSAVDLSPDWSVAFVDHAPPEYRRDLEAKRLVHADYVVLHDAGGRDGVIYSYQNLHELFRYSWIYRKFRPMTAVLSNKYDPNLILRGLND